MLASCTRRQFLRQAGCFGVAATGLNLSATFLSGPDKEPRKLPDHTLNVISGKPRERGKQYGAKFKDAIHAFLDKEIYEVCAKHASRAQLLAYASQCTKAVKEYSPAIMEELEGMAQGAGIGVEEIVLITMHEETAGHKDGKLPPVQHCTAIGAAPPDTKDGRTYVGQNWDWMASVYGQSQMLLWKRPEGPSLITYSYPGLWVGAGLNSAGVALCWTWGDGAGIKPKKGLTSSRGCAIIDTGKRLLATHLLWGSPWCLSSPNSDNSPKTTAVCWRGGWRNSTAPGTRADWRRGYASCPRRTTPCAGRP
jgi:hypothetical protein